MFVCDRRARALDDYHRVTGCRWHVLASSVFVSVGIFSLQFAVGVYMHIGLCVCHRHLRHIAACKAWGLNSGGEPWQEVSLATELF